MKTFFIIIAGVFCMMANAQDTITNTIPYQRILIEAGVHIPFGKLADKIGAGPEFGIWYRSRMLNNDFIDVGISLYIPGNRRGFDYQDEGSNYKVKPAEVSGMVGVRMNKPYRLGDVNSKKTLEWSTTGGYAFFMYNDKKVRSGNGSTRNDVVGNTKALSTFQIGQGIKFTNNNLGIQLNYNYTPYGLLSRHVPDNFGSHSFTISVFYKL